MAGRKIDDHSGFPGKGGKSYPLPEGNKMKSYSSSEGSGHVGTNYPDTSERIHSDQRKGDSEAMKQKLKTGYRY